MPLSFSLSHWWPARRNIPALRPAALLQTHKSRPTCLILNTEDTAQHNVLLRTIKRQFPNQTLPVLSLHDFLSDSAHNTLSHQLKLWQKAALREIRLIPVCLLTEEKPLRTKRWFSRPAQTRFQMGQPILFDLTASAQQTALSEATFELLATLKSRFDKLRTFSLTPSEPDRETFISAVLKQERVQLEMLHMARTQGIDSTAVRRQAHRLLDSIAANPNATTVRILAPLMNRAWRTLCESIEVRGMERLLSIPKNHQMVFVPCHRSHLDYLLLNWTLYQNGLPLPYVAAGDNLNMPIVGRLLQQAGVDSNDHRNSSDIILICMSAFDETSKADFYAG